jgi:preprotein translocase subunit SecB
MTDTANPAAGAAADETAEGPQVGLQKVFLKDVSFESPNAPAIFSGEWKPHYSLNMTTRSNNLGNDTYEVVLETTIEAKQGETVAFLAEVQQGGIFLLKGFREEELTQVIATFCPAQIYPYTREVIADLVGKGGFPQLHLHPVSFDAMFAKAQAEGGARSEVPAASDNGAA